MVLSVAHPWALFFLPVVALIFYRLDRLKELDTAGVRLLLLLLLLAATLAPAAAVAAPLLLIVDTISPITPPARPAPPARPPARLPARPPARPTTHSHRHLSYLHIGARYPHSLPTRCLKGGGEDVGLSWTRLSRGPSPKGKH